MFYSTLFLICSHIPPRGNKTVDLGSNTRGTGVFLLTLSWYFDRRETNPTLVCISPNRIPVKTSSFGLELVLSRGHNVQFIATVTERFFFYREDMGL
jgi:hypothetical protein